MAVTATRSGLYVRLVKDRDGAIAIEIAAGADARHARRRVVTLTRSEWAWLIANPVAADGEDAPSQPTLAAQKSAPKHLPFI